MSNGGNTKDTIREVAEKWKALTDQEKEQYKMLSEEDKVRYENEKKVIEEEYKKHNLPVMFSKRGR